ncbi:MAG: hypothetical protein HQM14_15405 [SAR324 cluster bacterium]|nr:hypothetical protein [SAR324 cluster bacterium]
MQDKTIFLQNALEYSAKASNDFAKFWSYYDSDSVFSSEAQPFFSSSIVAFQAGLTHLENHPFGNKQGDKIESLRHKTRPILQSLQVEKICSGSALSSPQRFIQLSAYFNLLEKFQKLLNRLIIQEIDYFLEQPTWRKLKKIHPDSYIKFYDTIFILPYRMRNTIPLAFLLMILMLGTSIGWQINSLFVSYRVPGVVWAYFDGGNFNEVATFQITANEKLQQVIIPFHKISNAEKFGIALDIRPGQSLEVISIRLLDKQKTVLQEFDFHTSQKQKWGVVNGRFLRQYQIYEEGIAELARLNSNSESPVFPKDIRKQLVPLSGKIFSSKDQLHQSLEKTMIPKPNRQQKKRLRKVFQRPVIEQAYFNAKEIVLISPLTPSKQIQIIEIKARVHFPF